MTPGVWALAARSSRTTASPGRASAGRETPTPAPTARGRSAPGPSGCPSFRRRPRAASPGRTPSPRAGGRQVVNVRQLDRIDRAGLLAHAAVDAAQLVEHERRPGTCRDRASRAAPAPLRSRCNWPGRPSRTACRPRTSRGPARRDSADARRDSAAADPASASGYCCVTGLYSVMWPSVVFSPLTIAGRNVASQKPISGSLIHVTSLGLIGMLAGVTKSDVE